MIQEIDELFRFVLFCFIFLQE